MLQREMRRKLAKNKALLSGLKLNRIFTKWKNHIRYLKVLKVKVAIVQHQKYRREIRQVVKAWRLHHSSTTKACHLILQAMTRCHKRVFVSYLHYRVSDHQAKAHQLQMLADFLATKQK